MLVAPYVTGSGVGQKNDQLHMAAAFNGLPAVECGAVIIETAKGGRNPLGCSLIIAGLL